MIKLDVQCFQVLIVLHLKRPKLVLTVLSAIGILGGLEKRCTGISRDCLLLHILWLLNRTALDAKEIYCTQNGKNSPF